MTPIRVFLVEDDEPIRELLERLLGKQPTLELCGSVASYDEAMQHLPADADVLVSDYALGGPLTGLDLIREAQQRWPGMSSIMLSSMPREMLGEDTESLGAVFVEKDQSRRLLEAIHASAGHDGAAA